MRRKMGVYLQKQFLGGVLGGYVSDLKKKKKQYI
jgi:hypothetical protein